MIFPDNDLPVRTPFLPDQAEARNPDTGDDEQNYSTLLVVQTEMADQIESLQTIHSIDVSKSELNVKQQIVANQKAYDILLPIYQSLTTAIEDVKLKWKARY